MRLVDNDKVIETMALSDSGITPMARVIAINKYWVQPSGVLLEK
jgi:hypothetical protein